MLQERLNKDVPIISLLSSPLGKKRSYTTAFLRGCWSISTSIFKLDNIHTRGLINIFELRRFERIINNCRRLRGWPSFHLPHCRARRLAIIGLSVLSFCPACLLFSNSTSLLRDTSRLRGWLLRLHFAWRSPEHDAPCVAFTVDKVD